MMVSEETAKRIAAALERLATAYEENAVKSSWLSEVMCFRCFPPHPMDWHNPCEKYR